MRILGVLLLLAGFLGAAFVTVRTKDSKEKEWRSIDWTWYAPPFALGVVGVVVLRVTAHAGRTHSHKLDADLRTLDSSLERIVVRLREWLQQRDQINVYDVHQRIDDELVEDLAAFVEARETISHVYGLQQYADLMSQFALGERNINRAWSASADGYIDEVWKSVENAEHLMSESQRLLRQYQAAAATPLPSDAR